MIVRNDRRRFLKAFGALGALSATPALARTAWDSLGSDQGKLRLAYFTDVHARSDGRIRHAMDMAADAINRARADIVLSGGDLIDRGFVSTRAQVAANWNAYMTMHQSIDGDIQSAIGNHDLVGVAPLDGSPPDPEPKSEFTRRLGLERTYRAFEAVGYHIIILDSIEPTDDKYQYRGWINREQQVWLKRYLSAVPAEHPIILISHMPLVTAFFSISKGATFKAKPNRVVVNNRAVLRLFENHNLVLVLQGHTHVSEMIHWRGTTFFTGGAISANWWRGAYHGVEEGFSVLTLHPDHIEWDYIDYGWDATK